MCKLKILTQEHILTCDIFKGMWQSVLSKLNEHGLNFSKHQLLTLLVTKPQFVGYNEETFLKNVKTIVLIEQYISSSIKELFNRGQIEPIFSCNSDKPKTEILESLEKILNFGKSITKSKMFQAGPKVTHGTSDDWPTDV